MYFPCIKLCVEEFIWDWGIQDHFFDVAGTAAGAAPMAGDWLGSCSLSPSLFLPLTS